MSSLCYIPAGGKGLEETLEGSVHPKQIYRQVKIEGNAAEDCPGG